MWPEQFTATMLQNRTNRLALVTLVYDWKLKANLNIISSQLGAQGTVWDLEHDNVSGLSGVRVVVEGVWSLRRATSRHSPCGVHHPPPTTTHHP